MIHVSLLNYKLGFMNILCDDKQPENEYGLSLISYR